MGCYSILDDYAHEYNVRKGLKTLLAHYTLCIGTPKRKLRNLRMAIKRHSNKLITLYNNMSEEDKLCIAITYGIPN